MISFVIPTNPLPKGRPRFTQNGHAFTPKRTREYENYVAEQAVKAMRGRRPFDTYVSLEAHFYRETMHRADCSNLFKSVEDAGNGILYEDDWYISQIHGYRMYDPRNPRTEVFLREVG